MRTAEYQRHAAQRYRATGDRLDVVIREPRARAAVALLRAQAVATGEPLAVVVGRALAAYTGLDR